jgi:hypothetical protein
MEVVEDGVHHVIFSCAKPNSYSVNIAWGINPSIHAKMVNWNFSRGTFALFLLNPSSVARLV